MHTDVPAWLGLKAPALAWLSTAPAFRNLRPGHEGWLWLGFGLAVMNILFSFISFLFVMSFSHRTILSLLLRLYHSLDHITPLLLICH
jgi:hypothetical protein